MPLSEIQQAVLRLLSDGRSDRSHLAGATGLSLSKKSLRVSHDLDFFHDQVEDVGRTYSADVVRLEQDGYRGE